MNKEDIINYFKEPAGFIKYNNIKLESLEDDKAVCYINVNDNSLNPAEIVHGGLIYALCDTTAGTLAHLNGTMPLTINSSINFVYKCTGNVIKCISTPIKIGKTIGTFESKVYNEDNVLCATSVFTYKYENK